MENITEKDSKRLAFFEGSSSWILDRAKFEKVREFAKENNYFLDILKNRSGLSYRISTPWNLENLWKVYSFTQKIADPDPPFGSPFNSDSLVVLPSRKYSFFIGEAILDNFRKRRLENGQS